MPPSTEPIFVVGTPRSGTTLLAAMLGASSQVDCGPETRFFPWLEREDLRQLLDPVDWPERATRFVRSLALQDSPVHALFGVSEEQIRAYLADRAPSVAAMLESLTVTRARAHGKPRWAEKTPRHIESLEQIRREWPGAHILRVVRDPRDVALSLARVPWGNDSVAANLVHAARDDHRFSVFARGDVRTHTLRYEDLVTEPDGVLRRVCAIVDIPFEPEMIGRQGGLAGIAAPHETWKRKAGEPLDASRIGAWRDVLDPALVRFAGLHDRHLLRAHGYEGAIEPAWTVTIVHGSHVEVPTLEPVLLALAAQDAAVEEPAAPTPALLASRDRLVFWGSPDQLGLRLGRGAGVRTIALARLALLLVRRRLTGPQPIWIRRPSADPTAAHAPSRRVVGALLGRTAQRGKPVDLGRLLGLSRPAPGRADE
jgi:hypothetical protein